MSLGLHSYLFWSHWVEKKSIVIKSVELMPFSYTVKHIFKNNKNSISPKIGLE